MDDLDLDMALHDFNFEDEDYWNIKTYPTIQFALTLAKKLQDGVVSEDVLRKGIKAIDVTDNIYETYRAMTRALIKETREEMSL